MRPHHVQAVEMSELVLAADPTPEVAALATRIKAAQAPEIEQLDALIERFGADAGGHSMSSMDTGMMSEQDMAALRAGHRDGRLPDVPRGHDRPPRGRRRDGHRSAGGGVDPQARELAETVKAAQESEIAEMRQLLASL